MTRRRSRLELTWANKDMRLLAHDDVSYEWVDRNDWRVAEVRLLHEIDVVGEPDTENLLIQGDALHALTALTSWPEISSRYVGKVKLCYIDPPFNTGQTFQHYDDALEHSVWLTMLRDRLVQIKKLLSPDGSVWVHLDDAEQHRARSVLDEVFGAERFVATVIWQKSYTRENRTDISVSHDYLHVYAMNKVLWKQSRNLLPSTDAQIGRYTNPDDDPRGPWKATPAHAKAEKGRRATQFFTVITPSGRKVDPPPGRCWLYTEPRFQEMVDDDRIWFGVDGDGVPAVKKFLAEVQQGLVPTTFWAYDEVGTTGTGKEEVLNLSGVPFSTPKPERLLERIIHIGSNRDEIVLDCFVGSGTTAAVAHKMERRWVAVELSPETIATFARPRLERVVMGDDPGGITQSVGWDGGGGFRGLMVGASMFEDLDGTVVLAEWATGGELAEAVAAQLGYTYEPEGPLAGRKGRSRLAVLDGLLTAGVADHLLGLIGERETLMVVAQSLEPGVDEHLRSRRSGSRARKVPRDLAHVGRRPSRLVRIGDARADGDGDE